MSSAKSREDRKPNIQSTHVFRKVKSENGGEERFRVRRNVELKKVMTQYCDYLSIAIHTVRFLYYGKRIKGRQTPDQLEMEDEDEIDAILGPFLGGGQ